MYQQINIDVETCWYTMINQTEELRRTEKIIADIALKRKEFYLSIDPYCKSILQHRYDIRIIPWNIQEICGWSGWKERKCPWFRDTRIKQDPLDLSNHHQFIRVLIFVLHFIIKMKIWYRHILKGSIILLICVIYMKWIYSQLPQIYSKSHSISPRIHSFNSYPLSINICPWQTRPFPHWWNLDMHIIDVSIEDL